MLAKHGAAAAHNVTALAAANVSLALNKKQRSWCFGYLLAAIMPQSPN